MFSCCLKWTIVSLSVRIHHHLNSNRTLTHAFFDHWIKTWGAKCLGRVIFLPIYCIYYCYYYGKWSYANQDRATCHRPMWTSSCCAWNRLCICSRLICLNVIHPVQKSFYWKYENTNRIQNRCPDNDHSSSHAIPSSGRASAKRLIYLE